jgi:CRP-like cAMP-binding protein
MCGLKEGFMSPRKVPTFDPKAFLTQTGLGRTILQYPNNKVIFAQGEPSDSAFYIQEGRVKLTVLSQQGKEATIALLGERDFMGEACITSDQPLRVTFATAITDCCVLRLKKRRCSRHSTVSTRFQTCLLRISWAATTGLRQIWWISSSTC